MTYVIKAARDSWIQSWKVRLIASIVAGHEVRTILRRGGDKRGKMGGDGRKVGELLSLNRARGIYRAENRADG